MPKCLTCAKDFLMPQVHYRCVNQQCRENDEVLSRFRLGAESDRGTAIVPGSPGTRQGRTNGEYVCKCGTATSIRICPHCHNELPTYLNGADGHTIYIVGPIGCGKSVYQVSTFDYLEKIIFPTKLNAHFEFATAHSKERFQKLRDLVFVNKRLFHATKGSKSDPDLLIPFIFHSTLKSYVPLFYPLKRKRAINLAVFDTSGEDCEKQENLQWCCSGLPRCSALLVLIDPTFFRGVSELLSKPTVEGSVVPVVGNPSLVIDNVMQFYRASNGL